MADSKRARSSAIRHVVLLKFADSATTEQKGLVETKLRELPAIIPEIAAYTVGQDLGLDPGRNADLGLVGDFASAEAYEVYAKHPRHVGVIQDFIKPILAPGGRTAVQFALESLQTKRKLRLNTSNENKLNEFRRMFGNGDIELEATKVDLREIDASPQEVVCHKATSAGESVLIEDTSLDVEGADVGVNIRWLMDNLGTMAGKKATWRVLLGVLDQGKVLIYEGITEGTIVEPAGDSNFGFDPVFQPLGSSMTLAQDKPDSVSARAKAVQALVQGRHLRMMDPIRTEDWKGAWQHD